MKQTHKDHNFWQPDIPTDTALNPNMTIMSEKSTNGRPFNQDSDEQSKSDG
ncbi:hypothetical protein [Tuberibacillus sp. Marseille-P3662]|uniref:hypothetical protein n=1 Tax=Tuberibacillus sp. Marseille-P3662 TaxID=1965358 RepID=UPI001593D75B|nr:hypothetical protein [Tuberibacillus sp. Marseille-P3662]